ncbi:unnamed protein product [Schistocephalus solidus]|uniref:Uncharacterized protein n=1 Tax=Schistocephalus solidus TaxID=70667 RepID=A0A183SWB6_SCHSO|nr:unnamed protein product [Schistocephalus solidus]
MPRARIPGTPTAASTTTIICWPPYMMLRPLLSKDYRGLEHPGPPTITVANEDWADDVIVKSRLMRHHKGSAKGDDDRGELSHRGTPRPIEAGVAEPAFGGGDDTRDTCGT